MRLRTKMAIPWTIKSTRKGEPLKNLPEGFQSGKQRGLWDAFLGLQMQARERPGKADRDHR